MNNRLFSALKMRYPDIRYSPAPDCPRCEGCGERYYAHGMFISAGWRPCLCLYTEHRHLQAASRLNAWKRAEFREE